MTVESDSEKYERAKPLTAGQFERLPFGYVVTLQLKYYGEKRPLYFEVWYEHETFEFRTPGRKDGMAHGTARLIEEAKSVPVRILFSQMHRTATLRGMAVDGNVRTLDWLEGDDEADPAVPEAVLVSPAGQPPEGAKTVALRLYERVAYGGAGLLLIATAAWMFARLEPTDSPYGFYAVELGTAIIGAVAIGFALIGRRQTHPGKAQLGDTPRPPVAQGDDFEYLMGLPRYFRYPIAIAWAAVYLWLAKHLSDIGKPEWLVWAAAIGGVFPALVIAKELGCFVIFAVIVLVAGALLKSIVPATMTTPVAIIIGAVIIGIMVSNAIRARGRTRE